MQPLQIPHADRVNNCSGPSVWLEFSPLSNMLNAVNLGQGFPDWEAPDFVTQAAQRALEDKSYSQYARSAGHLNLCQTIAETYGPAMGKSLDPLGEILVTNGASQALFLSFLTFVNPGEEVILIEPAFDIYSGALAMAGGVAKYVPLRKRDKMKTANDFYLDMDELRAAINPKTKAIVLNSPHNPTGKVFSKEEYNEIAKILADNPHVQVISDEVYEHLTYDGCDHVPFASIPGMFERTLSIYSAGKTFSITGWKVGWIVGSKKMLKWLQAAQQWMVFSVATPLQQGVSDALKQARQPYDGEPSYFHWINKSYLSKRDILLDILDKAGLSPIKPMGSFFIIADVSDLAFDKTKPPQIYDEYMEEGKLKVDPKTLPDQSYNACRHLACHKGVTPIPVSAFYCDEHKDLGAPYARFAFCKNEEVLKSAAKKLH